MNLYTDPCSVRLYIKPSSRSMYVEKGVRVFIVGTDGKGKDIWQYIDEVMPLRDLSLDFEQDMMKLQERKTARNMR